MLRENFCGLRAHTIWYIKQGISPYNALGGDTLFYPTDYMVTLHLLVFFFVV